MKKLLAFVLSAGMVISLAACGNSNNDQAITENVENSSEVANSQDDTKAKDSETLVVGFDQDFPPLDMLEMMENTQDLILRWQSKLRNVWEKKLYFNQLIGMQRIWN